MPELQDRTKKFFESVSQHADVGEFANFQSAMKDSARRRGFYDNISQHVDVGDFEAFESALTPKQPGLPERALEFVKGIPGKISEFLEVTPEEEVAATERMRVSAEELAARFEGRPELLEPTVGSVLGTLAGLGPAVGPPPAGLAPEIEELAEEPLFKLSDKMPTTLTDEQVDAMFTIGGPPLPRTAKRALHGLSRTIVKAVESVASPRMLATMGAMALSPGGIGRIFAAAFSQDMIRHEPDLIGKFVDAVKDGDTTKIAEASGDLALNTTFAGVMAKHATSPLKFTEPRADMLTEEVARYAEEKIKVDKPKEVIEPLTENLSEAKQKTVTDLSQVFEANLTELSALGRLGKDAARRRELEGKNVKIEEHLDKLHEEAAVKTREQLEARKPPVRMTEAELIKDAEAKLARSRGEAPIEKPDVEFAFIQEMPPGVEGPAIPQFNILKEGHPLFKSTVGLKTIEREGFAVPDYPGKPGVAGEPVSANRLEQIQKEYFDSELLPGSDSVYEAVAKTKAVVKSDRPPPENPGNPLARAVRGDAEMAPAPYDIMPWITERLYSPEFALIGDPKRPRTRVSKAAQDKTSQTIDGELLFRHHAATDRMFFDDTKKKLSKKEQLRVRGAIKDLYDKTPVEIDALLAREPEVYTAAAKLKDWFERAREDIKDYKREMYRRNLPPELNEAFTEAITHPSERTIDIAEFYKVDPKDLEHWVKEYGDIDFWGVEEYVTNIERGPWKVLRTIVDDAGGVTTQTVAAGKTMLDARRKASEIKKEQPDIGELEITADHARVDPLKPRKDILRGEANVFDALNSYSYSVRKKIVMDPLEHDLRVAIRDNPQEFPANIASLLTNQMEYARGRYHLSDRIADSMARELARGYGLKLAELSVARKIARVTGLEAVAARTVPSLPSRAVAITRQGVGIAKLGYRPIAGLINWASGHGHIHNKVGVKLMTDASKWNKTPEGKKFLAEEEPYLGMDFVSDIRGGLHTRQGKLSPMKMFGMPEPRIRRAALSANYLYAKGKLGMEESAARTFARRSLRFQVLTYNSSAIPRMLRSPGGKLFGQFRRYLVGEIEFISKLKGAEIPRYIGLQAMLSGPRGPVYFLKALPILGALGVLAKADEWLTKQRTETPIGPISLTGGVAGLAGADITAPATFQFPSTPEELGGALVGDMVKLFRNVIEPAVRGEDPDLITDDLTEWAKGLVVFMKYWEAAYESAVSEDGWVRDSRGNKAYRAGDWWDRALLIAGAPPLERTSAQLANRVWRNEQRVLSNNRRRLGKRLINKMNAGEELEQDDLDDIVLYGLSAPGLADRFTRAQTDPDYRRVLEAELMNKIRALELTELTPD